MIGRLTEGTYVALGRDDDTAGRVLFPSSYAKKIAPGLSKVNSCPAFV